MSTDKKDPKTEDKGTNKGGHGGGCGCGHGH